jgi:hypothetical protein
MGKRATATDTPLKSDEVVGLQDIQRLPDIPGSHGDKLLVVAGGLSSEQCTPDQDKGGWPWHPGPSTVPGMPPSNLLLLLLTAWSSSLSCAC